MNGPHRYRPTLFIKLDLIVALFQVVPDMAIGIVELLLRALSRISLHDDLAGAGLISALG